MLINFLLDFISYHLIQIESQGDTMADDNPEKKAKRQREKLKQQTVRKLVKNMRDLEASLDDKDIATIHMKHGLFAIVDKDLFTTLSTRNWHVNIQPEHIHVKTSSGLYLHDLVVRLELERQGIEKMPKQISFENKLSLDCRVCNLLYENERQGVMRNRTKKRNSQSIYKGVRQPPHNKRLGTWRVDIMTPELGKVHLGSYHDEIEAAQIYDAAVIRLFGRDGRRNFIDEAPPLEIDQEVSARIEFHKYRMKMKEEGYKGRLIYGQTSIPQ